MCINKVLTWYKPVYSHGWSLEPYIMNCFSSHCPILQDFMCWRYSAGDTCDTIVVNLDKRRIEVQTELTLLLALTITQFLLKD